MTPGNTSDRSDRFQKTPQRPDLPAGNMRIILTGPVHAGKSSLALTLCNRLTSRKMLLAGFIATGRWHGNRRDGFDLLDLKTRKSTPLARRKKNPVAGSRTLPFFFFEKGIQAGIQALSFDNCIDADIIMVDELGPLELQGKGWAPAISSLGALGTAVHIWIVRNHLVPAVCQKWPFEQTYTVRVHEPGALHTLTELCLNR